MSAKKIDKVARANGDAAAMLLVQQQADLKEQGLDDGEEDSTRVFPAGTNDDDIDGYDNDDNNDNDDESSSSEESSDEEGPEKTAGKKKKISRYPDQFFFYEDKRDLVSTEYDNHVKQCAVIGCGNRLRVANKSDLQMLEAKFVHFAASEGEEA